jgi:hypothetical protein
MSDEKAAISDFESDPNDFSKTDYFGFYKPHAGCRNWIPLLELNWDMMDVHLHRLTHAIVDLQKQLQHAQVRVSSLEAERDEGE